MDCGRTLREEDPAFFDLTVGGAEKEEVVVLRGAYCGLYIHRLQGVHLAGTHRC